jgi:mevalonate kinase
MASQTYYSNGKLLLTGEYVVLDGAEALAVPTRFGQNLVVKEGKSDFLKWTSFDVDQNIWFTDTIGIESIKNKKGSDQNSSVKNTLIEILHHAHIQNPEVLANGGYEVETHLTFPRNWGLGTSSTLINNIAQWFQIDAFKLLNSSFGGSGYDIACAQTDQPIVYQLIEEQPTFSIVPFDPSFKAHIYFVYLNQKQSSKSAIANYLTQRHKSVGIVSKINKITQQIVVCKTLSEFAKLLEYHEILMSEILETTTIKERFFSDFKGVIKSLGAWGGDFIMVISPENPEAYFHEKGYDKVLKYHEIIYP